MQANALYNYFNVPAKRLHSHVVSHSTRYILWISFTECISPGVECACSVKSSTACDRIPFSTCNDKTNKCQCDRKYYIATVNGQRVCKRAPGKKYNLAL